MDEYEYWQERCAQDDVDNSATPTPQPVPPPGADDVHVIALRGKMLRASFFGVSDGDEYLRADWRGLHQRGPKLKAQFTFADEISLDGVNISDVQSLAEYVLQKRLNLTVADLVGSQLKMTEAGGNQLIDAGQFKYVDLSARASVSYEEDMECKQQLTFYLRASVLHTARVAWAAARYEIFLERAGTALGAVVRDVKIAALIGHGNTTVKTALGHAGARSPIGGRALADIESTMRKHFADGFASFSVALEAASMKKVNKRKRAAGADGETVARTRTNLSEFGRVFIDSYLDAYMSVQGDSRKRLVDRILSTAQTRDVELGSAAWTEVVVGQRLHNMANQRRAAERRAATAAGAATAADGVPTEVEEVEEVE